MKSVYIGLLCLVLVASCKSETSKAQQTEEEKPLTIAENIANAHGFQNWKNVSEVKFTFQVDVDTIKGKGRSWVWQPKTNTVTMTAGEKTVTYKRNNIDSTLVSAAEPLLMTNTGCLCPFSWFGTVLLPSQLLVQWKRQ